MEKEDSNKHWLSTTFFYWQTFKKNHVSFQIVILACKAYLVISAPAVEKQPKALLNIASLHNNVAIIHSTWTLKAKQ